MTPADDSTDSTPRNDPHTFEVLGRVLTELCRPPGPLGDCLAFRLWPMLLGGGYVLSWYGMPEEDTVISYLLATAADDGITEVLRPGDIRQITRDRDRYTTIDIRGVKFQLRPEPMFPPEVYAALDAYWRSGDSKLPPRKVHAGGASEALG